MPSSVEHLIEIEILDEATFRETNNLRPDTLVTCIESLYTQFSAVVFTENRLQAATTMNKSFNFRVERTAIFCGSFILQTLSTGALHCEAYKNSYQYLISNSAIWQWQSSTHLGLIIHMGR